MTNSEQQRRRALKRERRALDRAAEAIAQAAREVRHLRTPSTRTRQAKAHHELAAELHRRRSALEDLRERMSDTAAELARRPLPCLNVSQDRPPIPTTAYDWSATLDGEEDHSPYGRGPTRDAAVEDLFRQLE